MDQPPTSNPGDELQFDHAEFEQSAAACAACNHPLEGLYWEVNGKTFCDHCRQQFEATLQGGSRFWRFIRACFFGFIAAMIAAAIWGGVRRVTGYEVGYVAIVVGIIVGVAVKIGSRNRGGKGYQFLAAFLTYYAICTTYIPVLFEQFAKASEEATTQPALAITATAPAVAGAVPATQLAGDAEPGSGDAKSPLGKKLEKMGLAGGLLLVAIGVLFIVVALIFISLLAMALPIAGLFDGQILWVIIIGIAVYTAWKINRREPVTIRGPFELAPVEAVPDEGPSEQ